MTQKPDKPALRQEWVLHAQWSDMPKDAVSVVEKIWSIFEYGNDHYYMNTCLSEIEDMQGRPAEEFVWGSTEEERKGWVTVPLDVTPLTDFIKTYNIDPKQPFLLHWWW